MPNKKIIFDFDRLAHRTNEVIGRLLVKDGKRNMNQRSFGRLYIIGGKPHIASKRGDSPNNMTGDLNKTIRYEIRGNVLEFGSGGLIGVDYSKYLEDKKGLNRPNVTKVITENAEMIEKKISEIFLDSIGIE